MERYRLGTTRRALNAVLTPLIQVGLLGRSMCILTVEGRKTGKRHSTPVKLVLDGGERWLVAPYGDRNWVKNARVAGWVDLSRARRTERVHVAEVDSTKAGPILRLYLRQNRVTKPFFTAKPSDPVEAFTAEADRHPVFRITPA